MRAPRLRAPTGTLEILYVPSGVMSHVGDSEEGYVRGLFLPLKHVSLYLVLTGLSTAAFLARADAPCDSTQAGEQEPLVQIGFRLETRPSACTYVYTVLNRTDDTLTAVQIGYNTERELCELTGARPHFPPDTAFSPPGWDCAPLQTTAKDPMTFTLGWKPVTGSASGGGISPHAMLPGFAVVLRRPDSLYEHCHWLIRFKSMPTMAYIGAVRPEDELDIIRTDTGTITGRVTDEHGAGIPGASIFVRRSELSALTGSSSAPRSAPRGKASAG